MPESVVVKNGATTYEFTYSDYKDWNNPLNPAEALYPGRMTEKRTARSSATHDDAHRDGTDVCRGARAGKHQSGDQANASASQLDPAGSARDPQAAAAVTPRLANGKPDLTGTRGGAFNPITGSGTRRCGPTQKECTTAQDNFWVDYEWISPSRFGVFGRPIYKPEFWDKVQELDQWTNKEDPIMTCQPMGLPRCADASPHLPNGERHHHAVYDEATTAAATGNSAWIPTDGRKHDPKKRIEATYMGYTVGRWEGDTMVLRLHRVRRYDVVGTWRPLPLRRHAHRREVHACPAMSFDTTSPSRIRSHSSSPG